MYAVLNILSFLVPLIINLTSGVMIILITLQIKQKTKGNRRFDLAHKMTWRTRFNLIRLQILKHKHILIGPILLGCLSLPRLILIFIFVCTKLDRYSIRSLLIYLIGFLPSMAVIFAYVWPSQVYYSALVKSIRTIISYIFMWRWMNENQWFPLIVVRSQRGRCDIQRIMTNYRIIIHSLLHLRRKYWKSNSLVITRK